MRCFCTWLRAAGYTNNDPFRGLRNARLPRKIVPPLAPAEIARLIACCDANTVVGRRDRAILLTLLDTGVRCAEAVGLDLADCTLTEQRLLVRQGKGGKDRIVPFAGRCADALAAYPQTLRYVRNALSKAGSRMRCASRTNSTEPALRRRPLCAPQRFTVRRLFPLTWTVTSPVFRAHGSRAGRPRIAWLLLPAQVAMAVDLLTLVVRIPVLLVWPVRHGSPRAQNN